MTIDLTSLDEAELLALHHRIVERIKFLRQVRHHETMAAFQVGDAVTFRPDGRDSITGRITRLNRKTVTVVTPDGCTWRVAPTFLSRATDAPAAEAEERPELRALLALVEGQVRGRGEA